MYSDDHVIQATKCWVEDVVIGLNFCPFAKREVQRQSIRYITVSEDTKTILDCFLDELHRLDSDTSIETTLIIISSGVDQFSYYLDIVDHCEALLDQGGYRGIFQLATFHPDYCFEGEKEDAPSNYTNRSPFPTLHLLRESSLDRVTRTDAKTEEIPANNIQKSEEIGVETLAKLLRACITKGIR